MGLDPLSKPPEMSIYLSLCKKTGLHQETPGGWALAVPSPEQDISNVRPTLLRILEILKDQRDNRVSVVTIFSELRKAPYGVRDGLVPIFLAIFAIIHRQDLAFYENGSFLREISGHDFRRLIKAPTSFDVQLTQVSGPRTELLDALRSFSRLNFQNTRGRRKIYRLQHYQCETCCLLLGSQVLSFSTTYRRRVVLNLSRPISEEEMMRSALSRFSRMLSMS